jgi:hypothetical protein
MIALLPGTRGITAMNMTPRNIILAISAIVAGLVLSQLFPIVGLVLLVPLIVYVAFVLLRNKGAAEAGPGATAQARQFLAGEGMAAIYVMRNAFVGGQQGMNVTVDGERTSQFRTGRFVRADVAPGAHMVEAQMASQTKGSGTVWEGTLAAGECVLLDAKLDVGALQGKLVLLEIRDASEARGKLGSLKLVEWKDPVS